MPIDQTFVNSTKKYKNYFSKNHVNNFNPDSKAQIILIKEFSLSTKIYYL